MRYTRADYVIAQELDELISKSSPYALSTPQLGNPTLHDFVKGLILSTNILQIIDKHVPNGYRADWGQVMDVKNGNTLSKECDIIIYKGKPFKEIRNRSMEYVLVDKNQTKIVTQVRSSIQSVTNDDKIYCRELKKFIPEMWYIAESCWAKTENRASTIMKHLQKVGYKNFFYFYRMDADSLKKTINYNLFIKFIKLIKKIK